MSQTTASAQLAADRADDPLQPGAAGPTRLATPGLSIRTQVALLGVGFLVLILMSGISIWLVHRSTDDSDWVAHSLDVQNKLALLQVTVRRAESGQRGYLLTSDQTYLDVYQKSIDLVAQRVTDLETATVDNPSQNELAKSIGALAAAFETEARHLIELQQQGKAAEAIAIIGGDEGQTRMQAFTDQTLKLRDDERQLLADRNARSLSTNNWLLGTMLTGALALLLAATLAILLVRRAAKELIKAQAELADNNAHLEEKVDERTIDLREANEEMQRFAYIVSHDLRSPLVNIMGFTGELEAIRDELTQLRPITPESAVTDEKRQQVITDFDEALGFIKSSIGKMDRLIHAILDLSRAGRREFRPEPLDLGAILANLRDALTHQALEANATVEIGKLPTITGDRTAIEQIFSNLLDNAVKYLRRGVPGTIKVSAVERGRFVILRIEDNGRGIEARDLDRVFELFRRAGVQDRPGEGIGLAHVRALVRRLGGSIRVESTFGQGTTFVVVLPQHWTA